MIVIDNLTLNPDHVNELGLFVNTARYLQSQGQFMAAEQIIRRALGLYEKTHGDENSGSL